MSKDSAVACRVCSQKYQPFVVVETRFYKNYFNNIGLNNLPKRVVVCKRCDFQAKKSGGLYLPIGYYFVRRHLQQPPRRFRRRAPPRPAPASRIRAQPYADSSDDSDEADKNPQPSTSTKDSGSSQLELWCERPKPSTGDKIKDNWFKVRNLSLVTQVEDLEAQRNSKDFKAMKYKCNQCALGYMEKSDYKKHMLKHSLTSGPQYCNLCKQRFKTCRAMNEHYNLTHRRLYVCDICTNSFRTWPQCEIHRYFCYPETECVQCGTFNCKHDIKTLTCALCARRFTKIRDLDGRLLELAPPLYCRECLHYYRALNMDKQNYYYIDDLVTDTQSKLTILDVPGTSAQATEGPEAGTSSAPARNTPRCRDGPYNCPHCVKSYSTPSHLRKHIRRMHREPEVNG